MAVEYRAEFSKHELATNEFKNASLHLLKKARMRGVQLLVPTDVVIGETMLSEAERGRSIDVVDPSSRDDGIDYEGDTSTVALSSGAVIGGYVYDIGPESTHAAIEVIRVSDVVLHWGAVGVCEHSSFQAGQRAVVEAMATKEADPPVRGPHALVVGESTVEWFSRISDSDGERTAGDGDLVKAGIVAYAHRTASLVGLLCLHKSYVLDLVTKRCSEHLEWNMSKPAEDSQEEHNDDDD